MAYDSISHSNFLNFKTFRRVPSEYHAAFKALDYKSSEGFNKLFMPQQATQHALMTVSDILY